MSENLLEVRDLTITPAGAEAPVLHDVSLSLAPGERVGLIGESGSGKSLTAQSVMGLLPEELRAQGTVSLHGFAGNVLEAKEKTLAKMRSDLVSMVFQEPMSALNPLMRIGDQIAEVLRIHGEVARGDIPGRVLDLLTSVHMPDPDSARYAYPHQMSGGQRQRVMLAIALANSPRLLICDEPTTALDVTVQKHMLELIAERVAAVQAGLLFITHDLAVVAGVCDRVIVMYAGRIVETGSVHQIFTDPQHEYTRGLLASSDLEATDAHGKLFTLKTALSYAGPVDEQPGRTRCLGLPTRQSRSTMRRRQSRFDCCRWASRCARPRVRLGEGNTHSRRIRAAHRRQRSLEALPLPRAAATTVPGSRTR